MGGSDMADTISDAVQLLKQSRKTIALTGAGVSTESGIPDFRSRGGLWSRFDPMEYGTLGAFQRDPEKVWTMLAELMTLVDARPNEGHYAMAEMEASGMLAGIITQNIDSLHQKGGSKRVVEYHGSMDSFTCMQCECSYSFSEVQKLDMPPRCCTCSGLLKPDIVFFDEQIPPSALSETRELVQQADLLIVAGTSCQVMPAAAIPVTLLAQGGKIIEINREPVLTAQAEVVLEGSFAKLMSQLAEALY
jgi:NAD-dependent protein deacetylase/lipoamidase